jgi:hypothetical protein
MARDPHCVAPHRLCKSDACRRPIFALAAICKSVACHPGARLHSFAYSTPDSIGVELACAGPIAMLHSPHMAAKKTTLESLAKLISESSASAEKKFAALAEDIADIKSTMATKEDIAEVKSTLADHTTILNEHTRDLAIIKNDVTNNLDKRLQLEVRVSTIEKHLGFDKKIAA